MHVVPSSELPLLVFHLEQALAGEHEEALLIRLGVIEPARLPGLEHLDRDAELGKAVRGQIGTLTKHGHATLEDAPGSKRIVRQPGGVAEVDHEPAVADRRKARTHVLESRFFDHSSHSFHQPKPLAA